jgi:hypothetical protein
VTGHEKYERCAEQEIQDHVGPWNCLNALNRINPIGCLAEVAFTLAHSTIFDDPAKKTAAVNVGEAAGAITGLPKRVSLFSRLVANATGGVFHAGRIKNLFCLAFNFCGLRGP